MMDGCSVNTNDVNRLCEKIELINVKRVRCFSHYLSLLGEILECDELKKTIKYLNMTRQSPKARRFYKSTFNIYLKFSGHVRWFSIFFYC